VLVADYGHGPLSRTLAIAPRGWPIEHIDAPFHPPAMPDADFMRIRSDELARIAAARAQQTGAQGWRQSFIWPAHGRISGRFGAQRIYRGTPGPITAVWTSRPAPGRPMSRPLTGWWCWRRRRPSRWRAIC
jgi:hypothetical protein